ncbi:MAG: DUF2029 domain-containing protein [Alphaproteobacteria bacterium]|nr:DUF2029 domain-containing protein [Alphaproteobacteria bacterium]
MDGLLQSLRHGDAVTRERAWLWAGLLLAGFAAAVIYLGVTAHDLNDYRGRPLGTDFSDVYAAGTLAAQGEPAAAYDPARHHREEQAIFGTATPFYGWHYPPFFLLIARLLAALPYLPALILYQAATLALYMFAMRALLRHGPAPQTANDPLWLACVAAFSAVFLNLTHGQNGFATAALLAGALALLDKRAWTAGVLFGLLAYKPQFGLLIPLVLAASGRWKTFGAAAATVGILAIAATLAFGAGIWAAFVSSLHFSRVVVLEDGGTGFQKIQSAFAFVRLSGGTVEGAYALQGVMSLGVAASLVMLWRSPATAAVKGAGLCLGMLLATPYCLDYDMMALAPAIALLASDGVARGFLPYEKLTLATLWLVPIAAREIAGATHVPLGLMAMIVCFALVLERGFNRSSVLASS